MPRLAMVILAGATLLISSARAGAQTAAVEPAPVRTPGPDDFFAAPGLYGTSYGYASFGVPRTHSSFSAKPWSPYYATLPPYGFATGRFGVGLWRPGRAAAGDVAGVPTSAHSYRTFPVVAGTGLTVDQIAPPPPIGVYAPTLGPDLGLSGW